MDKQKVLIVIISGLILLLEIIKISLTAETDATQGEYEILTTQLKAVQKDTTLTRQRYLDITSLRYIDTQAKHQGFIPVKEHIYLYDRPGASIYYQCSC